MIDVEAQIFRAVMTGLIPTLEGMGIAAPERHVYNDYVEQPPVFPHVSVVEIDNATDRQRRSTAPSEDYAALTYEVNIYSNKQIGRKAECKALAAAVDEILLRLGFTRISLESVPNFLDATIYRITGRYTALVSRSETLYRR